jgi:dTDP-4-amino-4,6-dideoxygalactose transaminase
MNSKAKSVPFIKPKFPGTDEITADYAEILSQNWYTNFGPFERKFTAQIENYFGEGYFVATFSSATAGLIASIYALLGRGDGTKFIVMPSFTFAAGADAIIWCGFLPLFVDIETPSLNMSLSLTQDILKEKRYEGMIAGLLFCNSFGVGAKNIAQWEELALKVGLPLIIDSAAGFGSRYNESTKVGSAGTCEVFSFHATKPFAIGEGGAVVSRDKALILSLMAIQNFGFTQRNAIQLGFNGKLQEINAAIGLRQFTQFDGILADRKSVFRRYQRELNPEWYTLHENADNASLCFATILVRKTADRDHYLQLLHDAGVEAKTYYSPSLHKQDFFQATEQFGELDVTNSVDASVLSLPIHDDMAQSDISLIISILNG